MSFIIDKLRERIDFINKHASGDKDMLTEVYDIFTSMNAIGIKNENDYKDFYYIMQHIPKISKDLVGERLSGENLAKVAHTVYCNKDKYPINTILNFYKAVAVAIKDSGSIKKLAYPQGTNANYFYAPHNLEKWVQAMRGIYAAAYKGLNKQEAFETVTKDWDIMEKRDFENWLRFYEGGNHLSYKLAQKSYYDFGGTGPVPVGELPKAQIALPKEDVEEEVEKQRNKEPSTKELVQKIIARLNAAEKLYASDPKFSKLLGPEYQAWLATLHNLKLKLQTAPIQSLATVEDLFIKCGNKLQAEGNVKAATAWIKIAQEVAPPPVGGGGEDMPDMPAPDMPESEDNDPDAAMDEFMENLGATPDKKKKEELDEEDSADDIVVSSEEYDLFKQAQVPPPAPVPAPEPAQKDGDEAIEAALKHVTIKDVILKLEGLTQLYKNRPLARELTIVDLMMDSLGISAYFPNLAEATKSALDSNQYVLTRIEDVLAKLRGAAAAESGQLDVLKQKLEKAEKNDSTRKEQKEQMNMTDQVPPPGVPVASPPPAPELEEPVKVETPPSPGVRV